MIALTREVSRAIAHCELTHLARVPVDVERARAQHAEYEAALEACGCTVVRLDELPDFAERLGIDTSNWDRLGPGAGRQA